MQQLAPTNHTTMQPVQRGSTTSTACVRSQGRVASGAHHTARASQDSISPQHTRRTPRNVSLQAAAEPLPAIHSQVPSMNSWHPQAESSLEANGVDAASIGNKLFKAMQKGRRSLHKLRGAMHALLRQHQQQQQLLHGIGRVMAMGLVVPTMPGSNPTAEILNNHVLLTGFWAWFSAQFAKIFTNRYKKGVWDIKAVVQPGGMPSSHSSLCAGVTTAIAIQYGMASPLFAIALAFSVIVMYDAMGVRQHAGKQAEVLNQVIDELMNDHPIVGEIKLKEVLGHTPRQVVCGAMLGMLVGLLYPQVRLA